MTSHDTELELATRGNSRRSNLGIVCLPRLTRADPIHVGWQIEAVALLRDTKLHLSKSHLATVLQQSGARADSLIQPSFAAGAEANANLQTECWTHLAAYYGEAALQLSTVAIQS